MLVCRCATNLIQELILFSIEDCKRSIPCVVDGLKPGQRKILFTCLPVHAHSLANFCRLQKEDKEWDEGRSTSWVGQFSLHFFFSFSLKSILPSAQMCVTSWQSVTRSVGELSAYHHGEQSLMATIIGMAQNFVGSNNIPLLYPSGQFGTRLAVMTSWLLYCKDWQHARVGKMLQVPVIFTLAWWILLEPFSQT